MRKSVSSEAGSTDCDGPSYLYLLQCANLFKIGYSVTPVKRLSNLQTGSPFPISVVHRLRSYLSPEIERELHLRFAKKRRRGEWFELDDQDVSYIKSLDASGFPA